MRVNTPDNVIAFVLKGYPRLSETFILNEILLLEKLGIRIRIFALRKPAEASLVGKARQIRAEISYIPDKLNLQFAALVGTNVLMFLRRCIPYWDSLKIAITESFKQRSWQPLKRFSQAAYLVYRYVNLDDAQISRNARLTSQQTVDEKGDQRQRFQSFHAHFAHDPATVAFFASRLSGIQYSISAHAKDIFAHNQTFLREKIAHARFVVTCTEFNKSFLEQKSGNSTKILRCYHGIDLDYFEAPASRNARARPRILSVGRFVPKKGFSTLLRALQALVRQGNSFDCSLIGGGPLRDRLRSEINALNLQEQVSLFDAVPPGKLLDYYREADIFALACEIQDDGDRDGIPNVIVEAMAMELPVVATDISGIPECVDHSVTGLLVPQRDHQQLAHALSVLLNDSDLRTRLGKSGRKKVEAEFDSTMNVEVIANALGESSGKKQVHASKYRPAGAEPVFGA